MWLLGGQGKVLAGNALVGECGGIRAESVWPALGPKLRLAMQRAASVPKRAKPDSHNAPSRRGRLGWAWPNPTLAPHGQSRPARRI